MIASGAPSYEYARLAADLIRTRLGGSMPDTAIVLGSGLGAFSGRVVRPVGITSRDIPGWPEPTVTGHAGELVAGTVAGRKVLVVSGRVHLYEGRSPAEVTFGIRVLALAGVKTLVLTNAAGGINPALAPGTLMVIDDHLNLTGTNPLVGANDERFGPRFPEMTAIYTPALRDLADAAGQSVGVPLAHGVYAGVLGPSYETPAEIRAMRTLGADAVGMSTVCEAIVARHMGVDVLGLSCISNAAAGLGPGLLSEDDVNVTVTRAADRVAQVIEAIIARL